MVDDTDAHDTLSKAQSEPIFLFLFLFLFFFKKKRERKGEKRREKKRKEEKRREKKRKEEKRKDHRCVAKASSLARRPNEVNWLRGSD